MISTLLAVVTMLAIASCCVFFSAACAAAFWRCRLGGRARLRAMGALLAGSFFGGLMFTVTLGWHRGPGYRPEGWVYLAMAGALAVGARLAVRYGTAREVLTATGWGLAIACVLVLFLLFFRSTALRSFVWPAVCVVVVPAALGLVFAPALLAWRLPSIPEPPAWEPKRVG